jgi:hypothetical protein
LRLGNRVREWLVTMLLKILIFLFKIIFFMFLNYFDVMILKIIF